MTSLQLTSPQFFGPKRQVPGIDDLLLDCARSGHALQATFGADTATLAAVAVAPQTCITLTGRWRAPVPTRAPAGPGALLLAPLMFWIGQVLLPHDSLFTMGRDTRTVADLLMRNYFHAACRGAPMRFVHAPAAGAGTLARDLMRSYLWIARSALDEPLLARGNAAELAIAAACLPGLPWRNPLLAAGTQEFQRLTGGGLDASLADAAQARDFAALREQVLSLYRN